MPKSIKNSDDNFTFVNCTFVKVKRMTHRKILVKSPNKMCSKISRVSVGKGLVQKGFVFFENFTVLCTCTVIVYSIVISYNL